MDVVSNSTGSIPTDIIIKSNGKIRVVILSMIHTSDPGQYGVDKSKRANSYFAEITKNHNDVDFWLIVDGVGFSENTKGTLALLLDSCHSFIQLESLYKVALRLHEIGIIQIKAIKLLRPYDKEDVAQIQRKYISKGITVLNRNSPIPNEYRRVKAGRAFLYL